MRLAMIENLPEAEGYCHQKGIFPAREAVVMQQQARGVSDVTAEEVFIGNGVSELIDLTLRALLNEGDEVLVPSPDYPLWTAAVTLNRGRAVHYPCRPENGFVPDPQEIERLITPRTRAIVDHQSQQSHRRGVSARGARGARAPGRGAWPGRLQRRDLRPDDLRGRRVRAHGDAGARHAVRDALGPLQGLPRLRLPRGLGGVLRAHATPPPSTLRPWSCSPRCACAATCTAQWAVQTALGGHQSIRELIAPGGRLYESRAVILAATQRSRFLRLAPPQGAMYAFLGVDPQALPDFDDQQFALDLLEKKHVLVAPGVSFNVPYRNHFRITNLPDAATLREVFTRIEELLTNYAETRAREHSPAAASAKVISGRFP